MDLKNGTRFNHSVEFCDGVKVESSFSILTCVLLCASVTGLIVHIFFSLLLWRSQAFHSNVRLLLQNFSVSACYISLHSIGRCCYNFVLISGGLESGAVSALRCELIETVFNASEGSLTLSMAFIGMDRLISTLIRKHVDKERPTALAYAMVAVSWAAGTAFHFVSVSISAQKGEQRSECYCQTMLVTPLSILYYMVAAFFFTEFSTAVCYIILFRYSLSNFTNFTINTAQHSLTERHQMMSNVKTSIILCPSIILHGTVYAAISLSFLPLRMLISESDYSTRISYALLILLIMEIEMMTQAFLLIARKDTLRKSAVSFIPALERIFTTEAPPAAVEERRPEIRQNKVVPATLVPATIKKPGGPSTKQITGTGRLIEYRMRPEDNDDILNALWESKGPRSKGTVQKTTMAKKTLPKIAPKGEQIY